MGLRAGIQRRPGIDNGREKFALHELIDALEALAFRALAGTGVALVRQQHLQIVSKLVHAR